MDGVSMSRNVQGSVDKNSGAPPWRDTGQWMEFTCPKMQGSMDKNSSAPPWRDIGQWMEFPCPEMCRDPWIKTLVPLLRVIRANGRSFQVQKCAEIRG